MLYVLVAAALAATASAELNMLAWPSTAFAPARSGVSSIVATVDLSAFVGDYASVRLTGTLAPAGPDLIALSLVTDGSVRMWVDDRLVLDDDSVDSPRTVTSFINASFTGTPQPFRLDYLHHTGASHLTLSWKGNFTSSGIVPASAFTPTVTPYEAKRDALRDRLMAPSVPWQTFSNPTMGTHVLMPAGLSLEATLVDTTSADVLGDIIVFRQGHPASTYIGAHSYNGSDFTELTIDRWGPRACSVKLQTTVVNGDLLFLATANGASCKSMALRISPQMLWNRAGSFVVDSPSSTTAKLPGFPSVTVNAVGTASVPFSKKGLYDWVLPLDANGKGGSIVGYSTGATPYAIPAMVAAIAAASARQDVSLAKWGPELSPLYEPQAAVIAWNTMFTPYEGVVTPVSRGWDFGAG
jgi:hypothetical protein